MYAKNSTAAMSPPNPIQPKPRMPKEWHSGGPLIGYRQINSEQAPHKETIGYGGSRKRPHNSHMPHIVHCVQIVQAPRKRTHSTTPYRGVRVRSCVHQLA